MINLYQPEKYKVFTGESQTIGLCSVWNEPEALFHKSEIFRKKVAILGTLYSSQGVNIILRNLALNPGIKKIFLWGNGPLSNTEFGMLGRELLGKIWKNGVDENGIIKETSFKLEKEISPEIVNKIIANVDLADVSNLPLSDLEKLIDETKIDFVPYMEQVKFPDSVAEEITVFPSEIVGWLVREKNILKAWSRVVERIMRYGVIKNTQYGYKQRELIGITWIVSEENPENPDLSLCSNWPEELKKITGGNEKSIKEYYRIFLSPDLPSGISYTYGNRLMRYPSINKSSEYVDQIEEVIIKQLKDFPDSRRAVATTIIPSIDKDSQEPPCITQVQAIQSNGSLHLLVTARSHDIFKAAIPNSFGLRTLQKKICDALGSNMGSLQITSQSAHIYEQDWDNALKLSRCQYWNNNPDLYFDVSTDRDPRGSFIISVDNGKIKATFQDLNSKDLIAFEGKTAKEISSKINQLELLNRPDHISDIAMELQKAEIALNHKIPYIQDNPLNF
ncbi:MAG: thymidylate synthase [Candidatus Pacebacteria bacterium]|nr:thymidylate synthase [Candidatus Paceibacterota bacterium]